MNKPSSLNSVDRVRKTKSHDFTITFTLQLTRDENKKLLSCGRLCQHELQLGQCFSKLEKKYIYRYGHNNGTT